MIDILQMTISDVSGLLLRRDISPVELVRAQLARIDALDGALNSYITVMHDDALTAAQEAEEALASGQPCGPLHGIPIAVKDMIHTRGVCTTAGSALYANHVARHDASVVERLRRSGAIIVGKANMHELAWGSTSINAHYGAVRNPWNTDYHAGGSSGGSVAAVAASLAFGALGSDTGCSIRQPAHCCGIVGLKPNFGRVAKDGTIPTSQTLDHIGPMTRSVRDAAVMLQVIAGGSDTDPYSIDDPSPDFLSQLDHGVAGLRIGLVKGAFEAYCDPEIRCAVNYAASVFETLGAYVEETPLPISDEARATMASLCKAEIAAYFSEDFRARPESASIDIRDDILEGLDYSASQYVDWQQKRQVLIPQVHAATSRFDALILPTSPITSTPIDNTPNADSSLRNLLCAPFNLVGCPALSLPCGITQAGMPIGLQVIVGPLREAMALRIAHAFEQATDWHLRRQQKMQPEFTCRDVATDRPAPSIVTPENH